MVQQPKRRRRNAGSDAKDNGKSAGAGAAPLAPALTAKDWKLVDIKPYPNNPRTHPPGQIQLLAEMIKKHGPDQPIVVDDEGVILKGHGRRTAALLAGLETFPVVVREGLTTAEKIAMRIADNQVALLSGWDHNLVQMEIKNLQVYGYNLELLGFGPAHLVHFQTVPGPTDAAAEWSGMPEFNSEDKTAYRSVIVHFKDQEAVDDFAARIGQKFTDKTKYTWFPEFIIEEAHDKAFVG